MASMAGHLRREREEPPFSWVVLTVVPLAAIFLQAYLPLRFPWLDILDLPLLVTIYFAISRRNPISGTLTGAFVGLVQDAVTHLPLGVNGIGKTVVGFLAASLGVKLDTENPATRFLVVFAFTLLNSFLYLVIVHRLLALNQGWSWLHEVIKAAVNAGIAVFLFALLDRTRRQE